MQKVLFVVPDLEYSGAATQLALLATGLRRNEFEPCVFGLGRDGPIGAALRAAGVRAEVTGRARPLLDPSPLLTLRQLITTFRPDILHAWRLPALSAAVLARGRQDCRIVASAMTSTGRMSWPRRQWTCWLLRRADLVTVAGQADAAQYQRFGLAEGHITVVPPGVAIEDDMGMSSAPGRMILCIGPVTARKGYRDAVWAFDILRYLYDDLTLLIAGTGDGRDHAEDFARAIGAAARVKFLVACDNVRPLLARCAVVWVPTRTQGGTNVALEALAAGRPVVASRLPALAEIVTDGETGFLVSPGDKAALARRTRQLLDDPALAACFGEAGRRCAIERFSAARMVERFAALYAGHGCA